MSKTPSPDTQAPVTPVVMYPYQKLENKFSVGDIVWVVFNLGPKMKVSRFKVAYFQSEKMGAGPFEYNYGFFIGKDGHDDESVNLSFFGETSVFENTDAGKEAAVRKAESLVELLRLKYNAEIEKRMKDIDKMKQECLEITTSSLFVAPKEEAVESDKDVEDGKPSVEEVDTDGSETEAADADAEVSEATTIKKLEKNK